MIGCHTGRLFQVTVAGGSYQDGLTAVLQGHPPGMLLTEQEIYGDMLLRKPGADEPHPGRPRPGIRISVIPVVPIPPKIELPAIKHDAL